MAQASAQRAKEAAEKEIQQGASTARMKWTAREIEQFKTALAQYGPTSNVKLAAAIETRTRDQVNAYINRFLKANPTWVTEHYRPAAPADQPARPVPTRSSRPSTGSPEEHIQRDPSGTQRSRTAGTRAPMATSRQRRGPLSISPSPSPSTNTVQQLAPWPPTPTTSPQAAGVAAMQQCNPEGGMAHLSQEEGTPSPPSAPLTEETISRIRRLDDHLQALQTTAPDTPGPDVSSFTPPPVELVSPGREMGTQPPMLANTPDTQGETVLRLQRAEEALNKLRNSAVERWEPEPSNFPSLAQENQVEGTSLPPATNTQDEGTIISQPREDALAILGSDNIHLWDPEEEMLSPTLLACLTTPPTSPLIEAGAEGPHSSPGACADMPASPMAAGDQSVPPLVHVSMPPPSIFRSLLHVPPFIPARLQTDALARESAPPTPPSSPRAGDPEGCVADQPPSLVPPRNGRLSIDPDNLDESLRLPFQHDIRPYSGRLLGQFEWVAFEETLNRWSAAIKVAVNIRNQRPPNPTSQWAQRRRREQQSTEPRRNHRASGWARRAAESASIQRQYRANPSACIRRILTDSPPLYCKVAEEEMVAHFTTTYATSPPLNPTPDWLFPPRVSEDEDGDVLSQPFSPAEVVRQFRRMNNTALGVDGLTYATWRWVDPEGAILANIYNICRIKARVPSAWKHSTVTLLHKGGEPAELNNWRTISLQLTVYKLYAAMIAKRIASWATTTSSFSPAQKGFLAYDGWRRAQLLAAIHHKRLPKGKEECATGMVGHQGRVPICVPPTVGQCA